MGKKLKSADRGMRAGPRSLARDVAMFYGWQPGQLMVLREDSKYMRVADNVTLCLEVLIHSLRGDSH